MLKKTVTYEDFNGKTQTDEIYFHLSKAEIAAMQVRMDGKFIDHLKDLVNQNHVEELFGIFRDLVLDSYGVKSEDGKRFVKSPEARKDFECSIAFSEILTETITSSEQMAIFTRGILPPDMAANLGNAQITA